VAGGLRLKETLVTTTIELTIDGHKLVALPLNPGAPGAPIVLLHGVNLTPHFWRTDEVFVAHGPCYALSLPGHYPAAFPAGFRAESLTAELIAQLLAAAIRELVADQPVTLVGISTGGFAALAIAAYAPTLARRVVCISGFAQGRWTGPLGFSQRLARLGPVGRALFKVVFRYTGRSRAAFRDEIWPHYVVDKPALYAYPRFEALIDDLYPCYQRLELDQLIHYYIAMPTIDISGLLPHVAAPTLVLAGDRDNTVPPAQARLIAERVPNAKLVMMAGASHLLFAERPVQYRQTIDDWLCTTKDTEVQDA
jgi:pimeloyl-ACP methyl ester carboxylesterase